MLTPAGCHQTVRIFHVATDLQQKSFTKQRPSFLPILTWPEHFQREVRVRPLCDGAHSSATIHFNPDIMQWLVKICRIVSVCICADTVPCSPLWWHRVWKQLNPYLHTSSHLGSVWLSRFFTLWIKRLLNLFPFCGLIFIFWTPEALCVFFSLPRSTFLTQNKRLERVSISHLGITNCN